MNYWAPPKFREHMTSRLWSRKNTLQLLVSYVFFAGPDTGLFSDANFVTALQESEEEPNKSGTRPIGLHYRDFLLPSLPLQREPNTAY